MTVNVEFNLKSAVLRFDSVQTEPLLIGSVCKKIPVVGQKEEGKTKKKKREKGGEGFRRFQKVPERRRRRERKKKNEERGNLGAMGF